MKWIKKGLIFAPKRDSDWMVSHAQIPTVDQPNDDVLRIYFSARDSDGRSLPTFIEVEADNPTNVLYVHSTPVLQLGSLGSFDENGIMPFCIVNKLGQKWLYYVGWSLRASVPYHQAIGLAVSSDGGTTFQRYSPGPICDRSRQDPFFCTAPYVISDDGIWKMWYVSCTGWEIIEARAEPAYLVKYAESLDGIDWKKSEDVCIGYDDETGAIARPFLRIQDGIYKMFYSFRSRKNYRNDPEQGYRLGYAESTDGKHFVRKDGQVGITRSPSGWDSEMLGYCFIHEHNGRTYMFYNGNGFGRSGVGYAVLQESESDNVLQHQL